MPLGKFDHELYRFLFLKVIDFQKKDIHYHLTFQVLMPLGKFDHNLNFYF